MRSRKLRALAVAVLLVACAVLAPAWALAASPTPTGAVGGDPRSSGQGPGLVGDPLFAIGVVVLIAVITVAATVAWVRATGGPGGASARR